MVKEDINIPFVQNFIDEVLNRGKMDAIPSFFVPGSMLAGGLTGQLMSMRTTFPDIHFSIDEIFATENKVVARMTVTGTQTGPLVGLPAFGKLENPIPPTGKTYTTTTIYLFTLRYSKIVSLVFELDQISMLRQLGWTFNPPQ